MSDYILDPVNNINEDLVKKIETFVKCPRCKQNLKNYRRKLLTIKKCKYKGVCDHCINEYLIHKTSKSRLDKKPVARDVSVKKYSKEKIKSWLSKIVDLLENNMILLKAAKLSKHAHAKEKRHKYYECLTNVAEPIIDQMFRTNEDILETPMKEQDKIKKQKRELTYNEIVHIATSANDIRKVKSYDNIASSLVTDDDDLTISSTDDVRERPSILRHKLHKLKKQIEDEKTIPKAAHYDNNVFYKNVNIDNNDEIYAETINQYESLPEKLKIDENRLLSQEHYKIDKSKSLSNLSHVFELEKTKHTHKGSATSILKKSLSTGQLKSSIPDLTDSKQEHNFSYLFPREERSKKSIKKQKSSSEIIKEVIEMLSVRAELEKVNKEKERQRKIAEKDRKAQARLEKKALLAESKKEVEPQPETTPVPINEDEKKDEVVLEDSRKEKSGVKSKSIKPEIKSKESKSNKDSLKSSKKDEVKKEKEDRTKMERDKKLKEKEEKEERLKIEKEKKLKEKAEKEERLKMEQERKLKEKEEKERMKKEKQDQIQKEKEERRKQKEDQDKMSKVKENKMEPKPNKPTEQLRTKKQASDDQMKLKNKENTSKHLKTLADEKQKEEAFAKMALVKSERNINKPKEEATVQESTKPKEQPTIKELNINKIKLRKGSSDDLILQLVKIKQAEEKKMKIKPVRLSDLNVSSCTIKAHLRHKLRRGVDCTICEDSELELDMDNVLYNQNREKEPNSIIIGDRILKNRIPYIEKPPKGNLFEPLFFKSQFQEEDSTVKDDKEKKSAKKPPAPIRHTEQETAKGVIRYALSDRSFIDKGWTMLPTEKVVRKMNVYRMRPAHPEFDWFEHNKNKKLMLHDTGEKLAEFDDNGKGRWFYRNGRKALDYYDAEEINAQQRFVIYSNGEPDERGRARPYTILATFDYLGNGIVFDHSGKIRLKYNQTEGVVLDRDIGPVSHWKWHTLNDPPVLQQVMIDTQMAHKDPDILKLGGHGDDKPRNDNEEMLAIEFDNFIKEKSKKLTQKFKPFQIKMKALKINENFSLKVLDQATVYLIFRDGSANLKLNIGMILDHKEIVDTDTAEVGEVSNSLERFPARTDSLAGLQQSVAYAQRIERARLERERRLRPSQSCASADKLTAGASRPLRTPFRTATSNTSTHTTECFCRCRKPSLKNIYYDTRLI